jgi:hypothetical protein
VTEESAVANVGRVILADFLVARCRETLESEACTYRLRPDGAVICDCDSLSVTALQAVPVLELVQQCASAPQVRDALLRVLADAYATHPDYQTEWHALSSSARG